MSVSDDTQGGAEKDRAIALDLGESADAPVGGRTSTTPRSESWSALGLRLALGGGALVLACLCWLSLAAPFALVRAHAGEVIAVAWTAFLTMLVVTVFFQIRTTGVNTHSVAWRDPRQPVEFGQERIPLKTSPGDWLVLLWLTGELLFWGLLFLESLAGDAGLILLFPCAAALLWRGQRFLGIVWRRSTERLILEPDRLVLHQGPFQLQIPYEQIEEVLRARVGPLSFLAQHDMVIVTRGAMDLVLRPGLSLWLSVWMLPSRQRVVHSGLTHESCRIRPVNELVLLEALVARVPHLAPCAVGLLPARTVPAIPDVETALAGTIATADHRVHLKTDQTRLVRQLFTWVLLPLLSAAELLNFLVWIPSHRFESRGPLFGIVQLPFFCGLLCSTMIVWLRIRLREDRVRSAACAGSPLPQTESFGLGWQQKRRNWGSLALAGQLYKLAALGLLIVFLDYHARLMNFWPLVLAEGAVSGMLLTGLVGLQMELNHDEHGKVYLLTDRIVWTWGDWRLWIPYRTLQEATLSGPVVARDGRGELRLRSAIPIAGELDPARQPNPRFRGPPIGGAEVAPYWQDRTLILTLAEPERFLNELGPHLPLLARCASGWIIPLPAAGATVIPAGEPAAQSTTNSTSRQ